MAQAFFDIWQTTCRKLNETGMALFSGAAVPLMLIVAIAAPIAWTISQRKTAPLSGWAIALSFLPLAFILVGDAFFLSQRSKRPDHDPWSEI